MLIFRGVAGILEPGKKNRQKIDAKPVEYSGIEGWIG